MSSPVVYPPPSFLRHESPRKRRKLDTTREPLQDVVPNVQSKRIGAFVFDDSDEEDNPHHAKSPFADPPQAHPPGLPTANSAHTDTWTDIDHQTKSTPQVHQAKRDATTRTYEKPHDQDADSPMRPASEERFPTSTVSQVKARSCSGKTHNLRARRKTGNKTYEEMVGARSTAGPGRARKSYYGVDIHELIEDAKKEDELAKAEKSNLVEIPDRDILQEPVAQASLTNHSLLWTEKYRAKKFTDLVGDERTHRQLLRWLKAWDPIVFPGATKPKPKQRNGEEAAAEERMHRKVLLLTGPPGLGKTTLAHVCAKQAGYEVQEINASDERSRDVVRGRIRDMVGTENVRQVDRGLKGKTKKASRPVCVVVDEVDGAVSGNSGSGGEGGFIKALADLLSLDQRNSSGIAKQNNTDGKQEKKGDRFRMLRPLVLICNDVYHPSLRLLRQGTMAEIVYVRKPALNMVVPRMQTIFEKEGVPCDSDGVRQLCEAAWGISSKKEDKSAGGSSDGDVRGVLVVAEWVASKLKTASKRAGTELRLSRRWIEDNVLTDLAHGGGGTRSLGRGGSKEIVERVFTHNAGFPKGPSITAKPKNTSTVTLTAAETAKQRNVDRLREMVDSSGEDDRIISDCFATYPALPYQDDTYLTKPNAGTEWLHFHDSLSSRVYSAQDWELAAYLSTPVLAFHNLFASTSRHSYSNASTFSNKDPDTEAAEAKPFTGPRAAFEAHEAQKANHAALQHLHGQLSLPLTRAFRSPTQLSAELLPYLLRMLAPDVKPVVVGGSEKGVASVRRAAEKEMVRRAVERMNACGITFERARVDVGEGGGLGSFGSGSGSGMGGFVYRMEPGLDGLGVFETFEGVQQGGRVRYAVRQVLEQEFKREVVRREGEARVRRMRGEDGDAVGDAVGDLGGGEEQKEGSKVEMAPKPKSVVKKDFFGRPIVMTDAAGNGVVDESLGTKRAGSSSTKGGDEGRIWVTHHEGYSNAVRKGITLEELMEGL